MSPPQGDSPRPRVLHCITHLALGGAERVALDLARGLKDRFEPAVFAVQGVSPDAVGSALQRELAEAGIPLFTGTRLSLKWGGLLFAGLGTARAVARFHPAIVHLHTEIPEAACATMLALRPARTRAAVARTIHNSVYWAHWPRLGRWCDRRLSRSHIAGVSQSAVEAFEQLRLASGAGAPPAPPVVIFNGRHVPYPVRPLIRRPAQTVRVLFAGRFEPQKGVDLLPEILARVRLPAGLNAELTLFGEGTLAGRLRQLAAVPPAGWAIRVSAPVADLARSMSDFDLVIMPSRFEGLSLVAIEAMLLAVPLVATDAPGLREQLPGDHPWRARAGDAADFARVLQVALDAGGTWPAVTQRAQAFARDHFSVDAMAGHYRQLYARALSG